MFQAFYHLREQPFGTNPDPRFLYQSKTHREALSSLLYRIQTDSGFLAMVAQPGMGKTTLLFHLLRRLQPTARTAFIFQTQCTSHELLRQLLSEFECDINITDTVRMSHELKSVLVAEANAGRRCIVLIDEAQNLTSEVLETVRLLSDFETPQRKLLQIILSGQNELGETLARTGLQQLRQRLSCIVRIQRFTPEETAIYIAHRLGVAGHRGTISEIFSLGALTRIAQLSEGVPRVINNICFNSLSLGFALERKQIDAEIIEEVGADLGLSGSATSDQAAEESQISASIAAAFDEQGHKDVERSSPEPQVDSSSSKARTSLRWLPASMPAREEIETETPVALLDLPSEAQHPAAAEECTFSATPLAGVSADLNSGIEADSVKHRKPFFMRMRARVHDAGRSRSTIFLGLAGACALVFWVADAIDTPAPRAVPVRQATISEKSFLPAASVNSLPTRKGTAASKKSRPQLDGTGAAATPTAVQQKRSSSPGTGLHEDNSRARKIWNAPQNSELPASTNSALLAPSHLAVPTSRVVPIPIASSISPNRITPPLSHPPSTSGASAGIYLPPKAIWHPAPNYPELALSSKTAGDVLLLLSVSSDGTVEKVKVVKGSADLVAAAESAVKQWKYSPALSNGRPVDSEAFATLRFRMY